MQQVRRSKFLRVGDDLMLLFGACSEAVDECQGPATSGQSPATAMGGYFN